MTPKEAVASFKDQFNTLPKLLGLKQALGPRAIRATGEDGRSYMQMHVPANNVVYQKLVNLTPDSTIEEVNEVLSSISSNPKEWIRAYQDAVSSGARVAGTLSEDADVVNNYIDLADSDFSVISKDLRRGEEPYGAVYDTVYGIPSSEVENLSVEEADRASVEAGNVGEEFSESTVGEEASALRSSISVAKKAEADANALASDLEAEIKEVESRNQPEADNKLLSELRAKLEDAKAEAHAQQVRANKLERRLTALATRTTSERITRGIRRKLNFNSKSYDTGMVEQPLYYVYYLMHNGQNRRFSETTSTESMPDLDWDLERIRTGMADNLSAMDENGNIENITVDFENYSGNLGAYRYNRADIPSELKSRLKQGTIDALQKPGRLTWNMLTNGEKRDIYNAVTSLKKAAKDAREEATDPRFMERRALAREAAKAVLGADIGEITDEMREITKRRMQGINPDYDGTPTDADVWDFISKHPKQYINSVEVSKGKKIRDSLSLSFLKIQRIAKILDGGKDDGPFQRIFVRSFMNAYDNVMKNIDRRSTSFQTALEGIIGAKGSKEYREKMDSLRNQKLHMHTRAAVGPGKDVTLMEAMGMYIYSQNINGFSKLVSSDGNNFSLEDMARINPDAVLRYINLDLAERADIKRDADHPSEFPYETPEYLQGLKSRIEAGEFVSEVPEWVRNIGDMMINELAKESPRIAEVGLKEYNTLLQIQDRYFPLVQASRGSWGDLFGSPFKGKGAKVNNGSIQARRKDARYPLMLDPFSVFLSAIREQENLINMTKPVADASYLLKFGLSDVVSNRFGDKWAKALDDYVKRIATPENTLTDVEKLANVFLGNAAAAKIGFNIMTSIKQFVSLIPAAVDGELSPADIVHGISQAFNPEARELMDRYAYSVLRSGYDPDITRLRGITDSSRLAELDRKAIEKFTWLTQKGDELSKAIIWTAKYDKGMRAGLSVEDAAYEATDLVNRTMSVTNPISLAALQTNKSPFAREFFLFTNDLFQMWNIMFADIPMDFKNADWGKMFSRFSGVVASAATLALLAGGWLPDKDDDKDTVFSGQDFLGDFIENIVGYSIPLVGQNAADYLRGYNSQSLITIPTEIFSTARMIYRGATGIKEYSPEEYLDQILYTAMSAAEVVGVPATGLKRTGQSVYDYDQGQWRINLWYLLGSRWGRGTPNLLHNFFD